jgi:hypothetical protein
MYIVAYYASGLKPANLVCKYHGLRDFPYLVVLLFPLVNSVYNLVYVTRISPYDICRLLSAAPVYNLV